VQQRRAALGFVFLGCRFNDQLPRAFARQIMKRSAGPHYAVLPDEPTRMEAASWPNRASRASPAAGRRGRGLTLIWPTRPCRPEPCYKDDPMTTLTIQPAGLVADVTAGSNLLQAILAAGGKLATKCGEQAKCGGCHLFVTEGRKGLSKMTPAENAKLDSIIGVSGKSRLACQATLLGTEAGHRRTAGRAVGLTGLRVPSFRLQP
jgi:2Fe-2S ferredoxin